MIRFLIKGLLRDRNRSLFPILVVASGVILTVLAQSWLGGVINDIIDSSAKFDTGHLKIMTRAYAENKDQTPNDLALMAVSERLETLRRDYPALSWTPRIRFGGLIDIPDAAGETRSQAPAMGLALDFSDAGGEMQRLNMEEALVAGRLPQQPDEILLSRDLAARLEVKPGETATLIGSTMYGAMAVSNFTVVGTVYFGMKAMDRGAFIADIRGVQSALDMENAAGEILGYMSPIYREETVTAIRTAFNQANTAMDDEFAPVMMTLQEQGGLGEYLAMAENYTGLMVFVLVGVLSLVLWNTGLIGGLRRYGEIGVRLAIGEDKGRVYRSMVAESVAIGIIGSVIGTAIGLGLAFWIQVKGVNMGEIMGSGAMLISNTIRTRITPQTYYIGFIPGVLSTVLGAMLAGIGIFKRQTAQLFKELEV